MLELCAAEVHLELRVHASTDLRLLLIVAAEVAAVVQVEARVRDGPLVAAVGPLHVVVLVLQTEPRHLRG